MGLKVRAVLNAKTYPTGAKISDERMIVSIHTERKGAPTMELHHQAKKNVEIILGRLLSC